MLFAFTAAQLAVIRLRRKEPDLERPFRAKPEVRIRGVLVPLPALIGAPLTFAVWVLALITHPGARYAGPAWLLIGLGVYVVVRRRREVGVLEDIEPVATLPPGAAYRKVLVPMKLGDIGEEMVATAVALAKERGATRRGGVRRPRAPQRSPSRARFPRTSGSARRSRSPRRGRSGRRTASRSSRTPSSPARSATRSSTRPVSTVPT